MPPPEQTPSTDVPRSRSDADRRWWRDWLGAVPDPSGSWELGATRAHDGPDPSGAIQQLVVHSYGSDLVAELFRPDDGAGHPTVVVPFYETATVIGTPTPRSRHVKRSPWLRAHGLHLAQQGLNVLAVPWWFEQVAAADPETSEATSLAGRYRPAVELHRREMSTTPLGRSVGDLMLTVTAALAEGLVTSGQLATFGHSLGGKLAAHLAAIDPRIDVAAAHELGLGFNHSNWAAPWYLGSHIPTDRDQDDLLSLVAPRPFLLAGGGDSDGEHNRHLAQRAASHWPQDDFSFLYHHGGHPLPEHLTAAVAVWISGRLS